LKSPDETEDNFKIVMMLMMMMKKKLKKR